VTSKYNLKISHETLRIAVCDVLEEVFEIRSIVCELKSKLVFVQILKADPEKVHTFPDIIKWHFLLYYDRWVVFWV
jgi:hypothetical protein